MSIVVERERERESLGLNGLLKKDMGPCQLWWRERQAAYSFRLRGPVSY